MTGSHFSGRIRKLLSIFDRNVPNFEKNAEFCKSDRILNIEISAHFRTGSDSRFFNVD